MKRFECYWDKNYYMDKPMEIHGPEFFTSENGYDLDQIWEINKINVGECLIIDVGHKIIRVE